MGSPTSAVVHSTAVLGERVELGEGVSIGPFAVVLGPARVGDRASIGAGAKIGAPPEMSSLEQRRGWAGDDGYAGVEIGEDVVIRENVVIHQGSHRATTVGSGSWILNSAYLAHDVVVGERATISAGVSIGGHAEVGSRVNIGMNAAVHQRRVIGAGAMIGMGTPITGDVPPFAKVYGSPPRLHGVNRYVLDRLGLSASAIDALERAYALDPDRIRDVLDLEVWLAHRHLLEAWCERLDSLRPVRPEAAGA